MSLPTMPGHRPVPMPARLVRCEQCGAAVVDGVHTDSQRADCRFPMEAAR